MGLRSVRPWYVSQLRVKFTPTLGSMYFFAMEWDVFFTNLGSMCPRFLGCGGVDPLKFNSSFVTVHYHSKFSTQVGIYSLISKFYYGCSVEIAGMKNLGRLGSSEGCGFEAY